MKSALLIILDGVGVRSNNDFNAVNMASTPNLTQYRQNYAYATLNASAAAVGLPNGQFGNSEVGHLNLGAGRIVRQDISKIDYAIACGEFYQNPALNEVLDRCQSGNLHIMGLLSDGGVHSHQAHIYALIKLASTREHIRQIWLHLFLDGRDTPPQSADKYIKQLEEIIIHYPKAKIATMSGRYYAMDRDRRWERIKLAYQAITTATGVNASALKGGEVQPVTPTQALANSYQQHIYDEFVKPTVFNDYTGLTDGDAMIFANFRADRAIQLSAALLDKDFNAFPRHSVKLGGYLSLTRYSDKFECLIAYPAQQIKNTLGEYISKLGLRQLRIAETEKYPHVTYFFNGGQEQPFVGEERILIDSPQDVATYDLKPEMSLPQVSEALLAAIKSERYSLIITNFANGDMVGHTGNYAASIAAVEALDQYVGAAVTQMLALGGEVLIVADHGNCEEMFDYESNQPHTQHTSNLVPCIYIGRPARLRDGGSLQDVAPTLLAMLGLDQPLQMSGSSLIELVE